MISLTVRRKIMGIAVALIVLMAVTAVLSMASVIQVGDQLDELTRSYTPAYGNLARANIRSVERALDLRRIVIEKLQSPSHDVAAIRARFDAKGGEFESEIQSARKLIGGLIEKKAASRGTPSLVRLQTPLHAAACAFPRHPYDSIRPPVEPLGTCKPSAHYVERRNRTFDNCLQSDGGAIAPQGAHSRDLWKVHRSAHCRRTDRPAHAGGRRAAARHDRTVLRCQGIYQHQRGDDSTGSCE